MKARSGNEFGLHAKSKKPKKSVKKLTVANIAARYSELQRLRQRVSAAEAVRGT